MDAVRAYYGDKKGKYPEDFGRILLREEEEAAAGGPAAPAAD